MTTCAHALYARPFTPPRLQMAAGGEEDVCTALPIGGHDCEFIDPPPESWECPVCLLLLREPHLISCCGVKICQSCISGVRMSHDDIMLIFIT